MTISRKLGLMVSVSSIALGMIAIASVPARAFDEVNWTWDATVTEIVTKDVDIDIVIGERPGGQFLAVILYEKQGESYPLNDRGRAVLPLFQLAEKPMRNLDFRTDKAPWKCWD